MRANEQIIIIRVSRRRALPTKNPVFGRALHSVHGRRAHLRRARDHVLDKVAVAGGVNHGVGVLGGLELPQGNVDGNSPLALRLELVEHPGVLERALAHFSGLLLELLDRSLVCEASVKGGGGGNGQKIH